MKYLKILLYVVALLISSAALAYFSINVVRKFDNEKRGAWNSSAAVGDVSANPYLRAYVAITGLLALNRRETTYYNADHDDSGARLKASCNYRLEGANLPALWWSITAYDDTHFLMDNAPNRYSWNMKTLNVKNNEYFTIEIGKNERKTNWLPINNTTHFSLLIRLYKPSGAVTNLPKIIREGEC